MDSFDSTNNNDETEKENIETIEKILQEFENNYSLKVETTECTPGSQLGDNYMSIVKRVKVTGKLANSTGNKMFIISTSDNKLKEIHYQQ